MTDLTDAQRQFVDGLRELADFLEERPELISDYGPRFTTPRPWTPEMFAAMLAQLGGSAPEVVESYGQHEVRSERQFGPHCLVLAGDPKYVGAEKRTVTRRVPEWVVPDYAALAAEETPAP